MLNNIKIGNKIAILMLAVVSLTVVGVSVISFSLRKTSLEQQYINTISAIADYKVDRIESFFNQKISVVALIQELEVLQDNFSSGINLLTSHEDSIRMFNNKMDTQLRRIKDVFQLNDVLITDPESNIFYTSNKQFSSLKVGESFVRMDENALEETTRGIYFSKVFEIGSRFFMYVGAPLYDNSNTMAGLVFMEIDMRPVFNFVQDTTGLGATGETVIGMDQQSRVMIINQPRNAPEQALKEASYFGQDKAIPLQKATRGNNGIGYETDYRHENTLAAWRHISFLNWGLVTKINTEEIYQTLYDPSNVAIIAGSGLIIILLSFVIAYTFSKSTIRPLVILKTHIDHLGRGILPSKIEQSSNDEIGSMAKAINGFVLSLKRTARFAQKIGEGELDAQFEPLSDKDILGTALVQMRNNIQIAETKDKERNWVISGMADSGNILRVQDNIEQLGDSILPFITEKIHAVQGAFYVVNDEIENERFLEMKSCYAYNKKKFAKASFQFAEGLVGQTAIEKDTILRTEIPADYVSITSGVLGDQKPTCLLLVPLVTNEEVYGVIELAGFNKFSQAEIDFVEEVSQITARTIFNIKVNERTLIHLEQSQKMSNELQDQQEVLRQNAVEMEATQEELTKSNQQLNVQIEAVNRAQDRMQILLEKASEVISIYDEDRTLRYVSPSVEAILGYDQDELTGKSDLDKVYQAGKESVTHMFDQLVANSSEQVTIQYEYTLKSGDRVWLESTGSNMLDDPAIHGFVVNSRDITERRRAEQEQRMRSKMQALSENSPDLITRIERGGLISYINPAIEPYAGKGHSHFLNKKVGAVDLHSDVSSIWNSLIDEVSELNDKKTFEMDFPSEMGERVMQVNAIPEYDEENNIESVLVVSHDITDRKLIELEIQTKNKKINDSINYSKRIQNAILPDNKIVNRKLPNSFVLYKPKDIVSGDFPWFVHVGDTIYIAAVDCTGHGVPGAMLSLIGYFLLNDIVKSRKVTDPGEILDLLDEGVTNTLRQDEEGAETKDGMDIALAKINTKTNAVEYAGAHRSLYFVKNGELQEIKGNKFAIGGGIYKNQTKFTTTRLVVKKNESIYFCSDGFPDQFGGPAVKKFGARRTRELIQNNHHLPMNEVYALFDKEWEDWKAHHKQTDDMLLIGIKF